MKSSIQSNDAITHIAIRELFNIYVCLFFIWSALALVLFVRKLTMTNPDAEIIGLFGVVRVNAQIYNITLRDCDIMSAGKMLQINRLEQSFYTWL